MRDCLRLHVTRKSLLFICNRAIGCRIAKPFDYAVTGNTGLCHPLHDHVEVFGKLRRGWAKHLLILSVDPHYILLQRFAYNFDYFFDCLDGVLLEPLELPITIRIAPIALHCIFQI